MKVLVLGATGMLGQSVLGALMGRPGIDAVGAVRSAESAARLPSGLRPAACVLGDLTVLDTLRTGLDASRPLSLIHISEPTRPY